MNRALQVRQILSERNLTLHSVSRRSAEIFGRSSEFYIPYNLFSGRALKIPTIGQVLSLSRITGYRLPDWLAIFGFDLDRTLRLQMLAPRRRTIVLDSEVYDPQAWVPWFADRARNEAAIPPIAPLSQLLAAAPARRAAELLAPSEGQFLYALVGEEDVHAIPHFTPGSIVRADRHRCEVLPADEVSAARRTFFLVEHEQGWTCSRLTALGKNRVLLHCPQSPFVEYELRIGKNARILGAIDAEIRPMTRRWASLSLAKPASRSATQRGVLLPGEPSLKDLLRQSRVRTGVSFREASATSRWIADRLGDRRYFASPSTLSDYETLSEPPRQIQKIITLCMLYSIHLGQFLRSCPVPFHSAGSEAMPDELLERPMSPACRPQQMRTGAEGRTSVGVLQLLLEQWKETPLFLRFFLDKIAGLRDVTLSDLFWVGGECSPRHPLLANASLIAVNRRARKVVPDEPGNRCDRPLYLILARDGTYLCGPCSLKSGTLLLDGYARRGVSAERFRNGVDAEVAARVTAVLRRLS